MMNKLGKSLVLIHVALSLLAMSWAGAILLQFVDWGWAEPRLDLDQRVPSELDKRLAAVKEAIRARDMVLPPLKKSQESLTDTMDRYATNHLFYRDVLQQMRDYDGAAPLVVKDIKILDGVLDLDAPKSGKPKMDPNIADIDKSLKQYQEILVGKDGKGGLHAEILKLLEENRELTEKAKLITMQLGGVDEKGNKVKVGLYDLVEIEAQLQARIRFERDYIQPQWAEALERAQLFLERRERLEQSFDQLQKDLANRGKK